MKRSLLSRLLVLLGFTVHRWHYRNPANRTCLDCGLHQHGYAHSWDFWERGGRGPRCNPNCRGWWETMNLVVPGPPCRRQPVRLADTERSMMRNALGLLSDGKPGRNYFICHPEAPDCETWRGLVRRGLAVEDESEEGERLICFHLTDVGKRAVGVTS